MGQSLMMVPLQLQNLAYNTVFITYNSHGPVLHHALNTRSQGNFFLAS